MLTLHHIGVLVDDMAEAIRSYTQVFGQSSASEIHHISSQKVNVCMIRVADNQYIELVEPAAEDSIVKNIKGSSYYHAGYWTEDVETEAQRLENIGFVRLGSFYSEAFDMQQCVFMFSPQMHLFELIQK
ncbi:MAG: methylmalonyl-CoA/ethylmalonyl-CoA epimerase [Bacteroidota bacterium]|nr:methylmalonyl-CoA/ethylmalonyl-CoA epimerase [Bacteroidota bacterium]